jgi:hypothetical protein
MYMATFILAIVIYTSGIFLSLQSFNVYGHKLRYILYMALPLTDPTSTYLAPSSCDRNRPPQSQVARKLSPLSPIAPLFPPPNSQPSWVSRPNVLLIRAHRNPLSSIQHRGVEVFCQMSRFLRIERVVLLGMFLYYGYHDYSVTFLACCICTLVNSDEITAPFSFIVKISYLLLNNIFLSLTWVLLHIPVCILRLQILSYPFRLLKKCYSPYFLFKCFL